MKLLTVCSLLAASVAAQAPLTEHKIDRAPATDFAKSYEALPVKNGVPTATDIVVPPDRAPSPRVAGNQEVVAAATRAITNQLADPDFVAFDQSSDGTIWAAARTYKAAFDTTAWQFIGKPAPGAPSQQPIQFQLTGAQVGSTALSLASPRLTREDRHVEYRYGDLVEAIDIAGRGVEQTFTFTSLPHRGELRIEIAATTALAGSNTAAGVVFHGEFDDITYSPAIAIDARGDQVAAPTTFADGKVTICVPAEFVAHALLPLRVDPLIFGQTVATSFFDLSDPDIAWNEPDQVWVVSYSNDFSATDKDCYVQLLTSAMHYLTLTVIDISTFSFERPRIASLSAYSRFMVVCQVKVGANPYVIAGRMLDTTGAILTNQFTIASSAVDELHPDIGGDPSLATTFFTVVWEHSFSATDHDIYARQLSGGAVFHGGTILVQANGANQSWPAISNSDGGGGPLSSQRFTIVYQQTFSATDQDIYGAMLTWDGVVVPVAGLDTFPIETTGNNCLFPAVSSPTLLDSTGQRLILAVFERANSNNGDIVGICFDQAGSYRASANINQIEGDPIRLGWPQSHASVDSDGMRFVVGYQELFNNDPVVNQLNTRVTLVARFGADLVAEEVLEGLLFGRDSNLQIASRYSGSGAYDPSSYGQRYGFTYDRDPFLQTTTYAIESVVLYALPHGFYAVRSTGCGSLGISSSGAAIPGGSVTFTLTAQPYITGYVLGSAVSVPIGGCPGCTLGVDGFLAFGQAYVINVPLDSAVIGYQLSAQGFVFQPSGAPCLDQIQLSDTIDVTIG